MISHYILLILPILAVTCYTTSTLHMTRRLPRASSGPATRRAIHPRLTTSENTENLETMIRWNNACQIAHLIDDRRSHSYVAESLLKALQILEYMDKDASRAIGLLVNDMVMRAAEEGDAWLVEEIKAFAERKGLEGIKAPRPLFNNGDNLLDDYHYNGQNKFNE